jgi:hypothetical protein
MGMAASILPRLVLGLTDWKYMAKWGLVGGIKQCTVRLFEDISLQCYTMPLLYRHISCILQREYTQVGSKGQRVHIKAGLIRGNNYHSDGPTSTANSGLVRRFINPPLLMQLPAHSIPRLFSQISHPPNRGPGGTARYRSAWHRLSSQRASHWWKYHNNNAIIIIVIMIV